MERDSRLETFEDRLWDYLTNGERARDQLCGPVNRALKALGEEKLALSDRIKVLQQQVSSEELEQQRVALQKEIAALQENMSENSADLDQAIWTAMRDLLEGAEADYSGLRDSVRIEIGDMEDPEELEQYSLELGWKLKRKYERIAQGMDEELRSKLMEVVSFEYGKYAGQLTTKLNESDLPLEIRLEPKAFEVTTQGGKDQLEAYERACKELSDKISAQEAKRDQMELDFLQAAAIEYELQEEKDKLEKMEQSRDAFRDTFHIPDPKVEIKQSTSKEWRSGLIGIAATILIGKEIVVKEKVVEDTKDKKAAEEKRDSIIGKKDEAIAEEKDVIRALERKAQGMEKSRVLEGRKEQEAHKLKQLEKERSELLAKQNKEMSDDARKRLRKLRSQILNKVDESSDEISDSIRKYLRARQDTYTEIVADLVNINLKRELEQKQTELDRLTEMIRTDGERRAKELAAAQKDLQQTGELIGIGRGLVEELQNSMKATLDKEKVEE